MNLSKEVIAHERIRTTEAKAKALRPLAEHMITFAKRGDVHARRQVLKTITDRDVPSFAADGGLAFISRADMIAAVAAEDDNVLCGALAPPCP